MQTATAIRMPGLTSVPRSTPKSDLVLTETRIVTPEGMAEWQLPAAQRPLGKTEKIRLLAEAFQLEAAQDPDEAVCTIPDIVTLAMLKGSSAVLLLDGQQRRGAFMWASRELLVHGGVLVRQGFVNVTLRHFENKKDMADAFVRINSQLVPTKPDDIIRALATGNPLVQSIEAACPFIGYDMTGRENKANKRISMSTAIRVWFGSDGLVPAMGRQAAEYITKGFLDEKTTEALIDFYMACVEAGWVNPKFARLWSTLNLGILMWLWRRVVLGENVQRFHGGAKPMVLTREQYVACMRELVDEDYLKYLGGRSLRYQDRTACYRRIKELFTIGLARQGIESPRFPMDDWG